MFLVFPKRFSFAFCGSDERGTPETHSSNYRNKETISLAHSTLLQIDYFVADNVPQIEGIILILTIPSYNVVVRSIYFTYLLRAGRGGIWVLSIYESYE